MWAARSSVLTIVVFVVAGCSGSGLVSGPPSAAGIYVSRSDLEVEHNKVLVFATDADGDVAPVRKIQGPATGLHGAAGVALDRAGDVYVANSLGRSVRVFARGAGGNVTPVRSIEGPETRFGTYPPGGLAVGADDSVFVHGGDPFGGDAGVLVFAPGARGNVAPVRLIAGPLTRLRGGGGVAVDRVGSVVVATRDDRVLVFARDASGNVAPVREISGDLTLLAWPVGVAVDDTLRIYVANRSGNRITVYAAAANGNVRPERVIEGPDTWLDGPLDIAVDRAGRLYVTNCPPIGLIDELSVTVYAADARGNARPLRRIAGRRAENPCGWLAVRE